MPGHTERHASSRPAALRLLFLGILVSGTLLVGSGDAVGQSSPADGDGRAAAPADSADPERPPPAPPADWVDAVLFPIRVAALPIELLGEGVELAIEPALRATAILGELKTWGINVGVGSVGPRSGPGGKLHVTRFAPFHIRSEVAVRGSHRHRAWVRLRRAPPTATIGAGFRRWAEPLFWGVGPETQPEDAVDYRWDQWDVSLESRLLDRGTLRIGIRGGWELNRTGAGSDAGFPDITSRYGPMELVGLDAETRFARLGASVTVDGTSRVGLQTRGAELSLDGSLFRGLSGTRADFRRIEVRGGGYVPFNPFQMLALKGRLEFNRADSSRGVPFTHLASLGDDVGSRAYPDGRFRGNDLAAATMEYRWELWRETGERSRLEAFLFYEQGVVGRELSRIASAEWRPSYGFGLRLVGRGGPTFGGYVADGDEGPRVQIRAMVEP